MISFSYFLIHYTFKSLQITFIYKQSIGKKVYPTASDSVDKTAVSLNRLFWVCCTSKNI